MGNSSHRPSLRDFRLYGETPSRKHTEALQRPEPNGDNDKINVEDEQYTVSSSAPTFCLFIIYLAEYIIIGNGDGGEKNGLAWSDGWWPSGAASAFTK